MRCRACGAELALEDQFCGVCGTPRARLAPRFEQAARQFALLRDRYHAGTLDQAAYDAALAELVVEDSGGYWMLGADSGAWYWHNGQEWVRRDPPAGDVPVDAVPPQPATRPSRRRWWLIAGPAAVLLLCIAVVAVFLLATPYGRLLLNSAAVLIDPQAVVAYQERTAAYGEPGDPPPSAGPATPTPISPAAQTPPPLTATVVPQTDPTPTPHTRELLYYNDFEAAKDPVIGDQGQVRWEEGELRVLVSAVGRSLKAQFSGYQVADFRLHVTARPVRLHPGSSYGVAVRTDPTLAEPGGGYWFHVRGDGQCRVCVESSSGAVECPSDWQACPANSDEGNWIVIQAIGPALRFTLNEAVVSEVEDATHADGTVVLWVSNDDATSNTLVAFDDLAIFEP